MRTWIALTWLLAAAPAVAAAPATVAVGFDRSRVRPLIAEGLADRATRRKVGPDDPVRIASVSKLVTALGVLRLVDAEVLDLDRDVSATLGWRLRNPAFPDRAITLRLLLSHQASLTDAADYAIPLGESLRRRLADLRAWDGAHAPGSGWFAYANLNFPVVASVMEAATGERFDRLMRRLVLAPLQIDACYNWSGCNPRAIRRAVVLYRASGEVARDDLRGVPPPCPVVADGACDLSGYAPGSNGALFAPQGGLRISMRDLATIGRMLANRGRGFLSPAAFAALTRAHWRFDGGNGVGEAGVADGSICAYGLGLQLIGGGGPGCRDDLFGDGRARLGHSGDAYGLRSGLWLDPASGRGLAYFTTAVPDDAPHGRSALTAREEELVARAMGVD